MGRQENDVAENCPTAWFAVLERAKRTGDSRLESRAIEQLRRLGVRVDWPTTQKQSENPT